MIQFGNAEGKRQDGIDSDADETSDSEMYKIIRSAVQVVVWSSTRIDKVDKVRY
jgi:hypothetical protein